MVDNDRWDFGYGLGLQLARAGDRVLVGHSGGMPGFLSNVSVSRKEKTGSVVLASSSANFDPQSIAAKLALTVIDQLPLVPEPWQPGAAAPPELAGVLGRWWSEGEEFVFRFHDGRLEARWSRAPGWADWSVFEPLGARSVPHGASGASAASCCASCATRTARRRRCTGPRTR